MKTIDDFRGSDGWFLDKTNDVGPLTMAHKSGSEIIATKHYHRSTHEYFMVLAGKAVLTVNGEKIDLRPNRLVIAEPGEVHCLTDPSDDFEVILIMEKFVPDDKVEIQDC